MPMRCGVLRYDLHVFLVIVFGTIPIKIWRRTTKNITNNVTLSTEDLLSSLVSEIENIGKIIYPKTNLSTIGLARVIDSYLTNNDVTQFTEIQTQIAPMLFQAYTTIPQVSQVSYISRNGLLFSYITKLNTSFSVFANSSSGEDYTWYTQTVDQLTGRLNGNAKKSQRYTDWFQDVQGNCTTAFVGTSLGGEDNENLFHRVVSLNSKKGAVSLGFPVKTFTGVLNRLNLHGGELYMWNKDGTLLVRQGYSLNASFFFSNGSTCFGKESKFQAFCSVLEVSGVPLSYTLVFPNKDRGLSIENASMYLLIVTMFLGLCWPLGFVVFMLQAARRDMHMRVTLINQMEATQQAERKSMNKSQAFASASHDIRGSLAGITGLIDLCREEVRPGCELETSLDQVNACTKDLVALLNSVLDMSKVESGKMQLEEEEFNLAKLLEDVIDFFHPMAMKKGVDVVLDLHDGSVFKFSNVRGDRGKMKQILNNLVSNAVKFTVNGHISIRALAQKPSSNSTVFLVSDPKRNASMFSKCKGIPMEMRKSVFENYVQVRETAQGQQGTGLGLGIVQSLVRLMGGEIRIIDKAMGEKGTCFHFNVLLTTLECSVSDMKVRYDIEAGGDCISTPNLGLRITTLLGGGINIRNLSPRLNNFLGSSPKHDGSRVVLLLKDEERRRVTEKYIKSLEIKVTVVEKWEHLNHALERLFRFSPQSSMGRAECSLRSRELPLIGMDGKSQIPRMRSKSFSTVVLLMIDAKTGPFSELNDIVEQFRRGLHHGISCRVVWINAPPNACENERGDINCSKPLHGPRLNRVLKMLPEFGGNEPIETPSERESFINSARTGQKPIGNPEDEQGTSKPSDDENILNGKRVLVVDDDHIPSLVATRNLKKIGVSEVKQCNSGKEAVRLVSEWLTQREQQGSIDMLPFDYIFMDCQMPEMDGYEATREIRKVERKYGVHIPIIAVSGHDPCSKEARETIEAGMDAFLEKPLNQDQLCKVMRELESKI
ncbi:unnamed protein product [Arabis nemorensis]|uniref:histidine kinase n=1 Tax=Arabis nemorensis TaxID=586526 RepID=A0A565BIP2_9BRAS|nr:unnamed protein product [Arabis nemorensis]